MDENTNVLCGTVDEYGFYSSVQSKPVQWLWYPYIPAGKITLLQGDPGDGKSTFIIRILSIITTSGTFPNGEIASEPNNVIYQCNEDDMSDSIRPRLEAAGADCARVAFIDDPEGTLTFVDERIYSVIKKINAKALVIDPVQAYMPANADMTSAVSMRTYMQKLGNIAEKTGCAVILIGHMNKTAGSKNMYRGLGSIDIMAIARSVLMIERDVHHPDIRYVFPIKSNLAPEGKAIGFVLDRDKGFQWIGECLTDNDLYDTAGDSYNNKRQKAAELLRVMLSAKAIPSTEVLERITGFGISERTCRAASKDIGVKTYKMKNVWYWELPHDELSR